MSLTIKKCGCGDTGNGQNYGLANCQTGIDVAEDAYFMSVTKAAGGTNGIQAGDTLDQTFFDLRFKAEVPEDRWYPIKEIEDVQSPPVDKKTKEYPSGRIIPLANGIQQTSFTVPVADPNKFGKKIEARKCLTDQGIMYKDRDGKLVGQTTTDSTDFGPIKIIDGTLDYQIFPKTDDDDPHVVISFQHSRETSTADADFIEPSSFVDYSLDSAEALNDANIVITSSGLTTIEFTVRDDWGGYTTGSTGSGVPVGGLGATTLDIYDRSGAAVEPTSSITEGSVGVYTATYTTPLSGGELMEVRGILGVYVQIDHDLKRFKDVFLVAS
jgi:hypothetical protein